MPDSYIKDMISEGYGLSQMASTLRVSETAFLIRYSNYKVNMYK